MALQDFLTQNFTTFFTTSATRKKYLFINKNGYYYYNKKIDGKVVKISLRTKNVGEAIQHANFLNTQGVKKVKMKLSAKLEQVKSNEQEQANDFEFELMQLCRKYKIKNFKLDTPQESSLTIKETFEKFLKYKKNATKVKQATLDLYSTAYKYLLNFVDENEKITFFSAYFFQEVQETLVLVPANMHKYAEFRNLPIKKVIKLNEAKETPLKLLSNKTVNNLMLVYKTYLDYLLKQLKVISINPLNSYEMLPEEDNHYPEFTNEELISLFSYLKFNTMVEIYDICMLLLHTGMRISELAHLKKENVFKVNNNYFLDILDSKTKNGIRQIPIHRSLQKSSYLQDIETNPQEYLFFKDAKTTDRSNYFSKKLLKLIKSIQTTEIDKTTNQPKVITKVLHSFRSNFAQMLYQIEDLDEVVIKILIGHSTKNNITFTIYNKNKLFYDKLADTINSISYGQTIEEIYNRCNTMLYHKKQAEIKNSIKKGSRVNVGY